MIATKCSASANNVFYLSDDCAWSNPGISVPLFRSDPDIMFDNESGADVGDCLKAANYKGMPVTISWSLLPDDITGGVTCSPTQGSYTITVPNF